MRLHKYWKFTSEYGVKKNKKKKNVKIHFFMPHLRVGQTNSSLELSKGQLMKPKIVLFKLMKTIFL